MSFKSPKCVLSYDHSTLRHTSPGVSLIYIARICRVIISKVQRQIHGYVKKISFTHKPCKFRLWENKYRGYKIEFMKKFLQRLTVLVIVLFATPFALYIVGSAVSFASFYFPGPETKTDACTSYYVGVSKGTIWSRGEWHHYVDFKVDNSSTYKYWKVVNAPLPSAVWKGSVSSTDTIRVNYRWPSNWSDPFPVSAWKICASNSRHVH